MQLSLISVDDSKALSALFSRFALGRVPRALLALAFLSLSAPAQTLPTGDRWISHLQNELLTFWDQPTALGSPQGNFPSTRCDNGSTLDFKNPCPEIKGNYYLLTPIRYLVSESRQAYGYGVAFHLTGDPKYLAYMKAGIDYIRANAIDRDGGGMYTQQDLTTGQWGPKREFRNPQELGYGLLGMAFYYYLTRDPTVLPDILAIKDYIFTNYYNSSLNTLQWQLADDGSHQWQNKQLVAALDQMNTYLVLLAPILPEPYQSDWKNTIHSLAYIIIDNFYSSDSGLIFLNATNPSDTDLTKSGTDYGHNAKALWMIRWTGLLTGDDYLVQFAETQGTQLFQRAYLTDQQTWAQGILPGGATDLNKTWWIHAELDQYAATLSLKDPSFGQYLPQTNDFWFQYFVDHQYGEVWTDLNAANAPQHDEPKQWPWKNAYHSFEHPLVGYITSQQWYGQPATLYYGFDQLPDLSQIHPYYFSGSISQVQGSSGLWAVTFQRIQ